MVLFGLPKDPSAILIDTIEGMYDATRYLIGLGHRRIAYAVGADAFQVPFHRLQGFQRALQEAGIVENREWLLSDAVCSKETVDAFTKRVLQNKVRPTAIMYLNDEMAFVGLHAIHSMGLRVPQDVSVVGFNDSPLAQLTWPELTTVHQPLDELAKLVIQILKDQIGGKPVELGEYRMLKAQLIVRNSTAPAP